MKGLIRRQGDAHGSRMVDESCGLIQKEIEIEKGMRWNDD